MPFNVKPEVQQPIRDLVGEIGPEIQKLGYEWDRKPDGFAFDIFKILAARGLVGFNMPKEYGGGGHSALEYATMIETVAYYDAPSSLLAAVSQLAVDPISRVGTDKQKKAIIPKCATGELIPAFALTEPNAGSDAANQSTVAESDGDNYVINGEKIFIMHGDVAHVGVVFAKIQEDGVRDKVSAMLVDLKQSGVRAETLMHKMGMKYATTGRLWFKDVKVPKENLLGEPGAPGHPVDDR